MTSNRDEYPDQRGQVYNTDSRTQRQDAPESRGYDNQFGYIQE